MILIYLSLILTLIGLSFWITGAILHKKSTQLERKKRKKQREKALHFGTIAKIILIVAALCFVTGLMMLHGVKIDQQ
jgi:hypothetical protein